MTRRVWLVLGAMVLAGCSGSDATTTTTATVSTTMTAVEEGDVMELSSPAFVHGATIPTRFTCDGDDVSPELAIASIPDGTVSLALIVDDPDVPSGTWDHWVAYDIRPVSSIAENVGSLGTAGMNSWQRTGYDGPCPPSGTHRYFFTVLALDTDLALAEGSTKSDLHNAADGHVIAEAVLMGTYTR